MDYFISDLHLSPDEPKLNQAYEDFLAYCKAQPPQCLYILGDLFDYYLGFDAIGQWGETVAQKLAGLSEQGIVCYFLPGNRDFLVDKRFLKMANLLLLKENSVLEKDSKRILVSHGDGYCIHDKYHQWYRKLSGYSLMKRLFLSLSKSYRLGLAEKIRQKGRSRSLTELQIEPDDHLIVKELQKNQAQTLIHGHTHRPMIRYFLNNQQQFQHLVLPDWRDKAEFVQLNENNSFEFKAL